MKLKNKVALITGAGGGFGRAIAVRLAREGAKIGINDVNPKGIQETLESIHNISGEGLALEGDVGDPNEVKEMFQKIKSKWGTIDILVNNAGMVFKPEWQDYIELHNVAVLKVVDEVMKTGKPQESMKITSSFKDEWWHIPINVMLNGTFYCTREALKVMEEKRRGKIINMASITGEHGEPNVPAYAAAKGGIIAFTKSVAKEVIGSGIIVNAVSPGYCNTPLLDNLDGGVRAFLTSQVPVGRLGTPEEIASLVVYLATDEANYIVGQVITIDGGMKI